MVLANEITLLSLAFLEISILYKCVNLIPFFREIAHIYDLICDYI